ncbi:MAG: VWA domain-containing protein [Ruminococcaceae bacterium]|nr:VWA domain-containing protein [Oscillospiraceae bacterium]
MGFWDKLFGNDNNTSSKTEHTSVSPTIDMSKSAESLNKVLINMSKGNKINMTKHIARVALAMDYSGSMSNLFVNGSVQEVITRLLPIALKFDDNGELESWLFSNDKERLEAVTINNYKNYVKSEMMNANIRMGGTNYAPVLKDIVEYYKDVEPSEIPAFIIFITDGENWDIEETNHIVKELSNYNMFVQFIGIGDETFNYLKSLDNMKGRKYDNTGFTAVRDMNLMTDEELYTEILRQYKDWLNTK